MTENLSAQTIHDSSTTLLFRPAAHTSLRFLRRVPLDDEYRGDEEEEHRIGLTNGAAHVVNVAEAILDRLKHQYANNVNQLPNFSSQTPVSRVSFARGRAVRSISMSHSCRATYSLAVNPFQESKTDVPFRTMTMAAGAHHSDQQDLEPSFPDTIDFSFYATTMKIVFDDQTGYQQASAILKRSRIPFEPTRSYADMWAFCLNSQTIRSYSSVADHPSEAQNDAEEELIPSVLIPIQYLLNQKNLFWLLLEQRPTFVETNFNPDVESISGQSTPDTTNTEKQTIKICYGVQMEFRYGALTSMNVFHYHPEFSYIKQTEWNIQFKATELAVERQEKPHRSDPKDTTTYHKSIFRAESIDRAAIFTVHKNGFSVYIFVKGNPREYTKTQVHGQKAPRAQYERVPSSNDNELTFSTVCLDAFVKPHYPQGHDRVVALGRIKSLFKCLLDFFYDNQINVCFGSVEHRRGGLAETKVTRLLSEPIQLYAFTMLRNVGYLFEQKWEDQKNFCQLLLDRAGSGDGSNDKFYCLCLTLFRRASEYHFLNLQEELEKASTEYQNQQDQYQALGIEMATIVSPPKENYAYVPSIRVTPTTTKVQPLKLVKLHRVLREKHVDDPMSFALVEIRDEAHRALHARDFQSLQKRFRKILERGIKINQTHYNYLHHSMSQVKDKQFWFLNDRYSLHDILSWMGNFDNERVVAKHAARIAQCFTSTEPSIRIPAEHVKYISDIETEDKQYCFTDGVGKLSQSYCKQVQSTLGRHFTPSVLQIRYGGCKGIVSMDPALDDQPHQLIIRESMRKFMSDHDQLEICKVSLPRPLHLNRQDILLLSNRGILDPYFLVLQNENHLWLVQALLCSSVAFELLHDRVGSKVFKFRDIASNINLVEEPFFLQLLIGCGHDCVSKFQRQAKIKVGKNRARNMFGTVDEYGVLEYGQVFIQFSHLSDEKLDVLDKAACMPPKVLDNVQVAITKNPCHHPGDLRTFTAVDRVELRHLVDVVVFPQKGPRPHPNEISGSDLDGDEYAVIWDADLVPSTPNDEPYPYDSQEEPIALDRSVERADIINVVLDIATQNLTGEMANLHLAMADLLGVRNSEVIHLSGLISQELDASKTGKHPVTTNDLEHYRFNVLGNRYPDFMMKERHKSYPSKEILGQLFRSARRALFRWHRATQTHCSLQHLQTAQLEDKHFDEHCPSSSNQNSHAGKSTSVKTNARCEPSLSLDPDLDHPEADQQIHWANRLFSTYRQTLRSIISVFNYQDEIDLFCRCKTLDQSKSDTQDLNSSVELELQRLVETTLHHFNNPFDQLAVNPNAPPPHPDCCTRDQWCLKCYEIKLARAAACYKVCYSQAAQQSTKARSRFLSFPWLFSSHLTELKRRYENENGQTPPSRYIVVGRSMRKAAQQLIDNEQLKLKIFWPPHSNEVQLFLRHVQSTRRTDSSLIRRTIVTKDQETPVMDPWKVLFIEIMNAWIERQQIFGECKPTSITASGALLESTPLLEKKPLIRELCWHELLRQFIWISCHDVFYDLTYSLCSSFEEYRVVFQSANNNSVMLERYTKYVKGQLSIAPAEFDTFMYQYSICLVRLCFRLAREQKSNEYAHLSDYLILALQSIGFEKELSDIPVDITT